MMVQFMADVPPRKISQLCQQDVFALLVAVVDKSVTNCYHLVTRLVRLFIFSIYVLLNTSVGRNRQKMHCHSASHTKELWSLWVIIIHYPLFIFSDRYQSALYNRWSIGASAYEHETNSIKIRVSCEWLDTENNWTLQKMHERCWL